MDHSLRRSTALKNDQPEIFYTIDNLRKFLVTARDQGKTIGFVPTMGNLHQGHLDLVQRASDLSDIVIVSIFVNPMQFGVHEDFDTYPRTLNSDCHVLTDYECAAVFAPTVREIYPKGLNTEIDVPSLSTILCGHHRPGHFKGVATVVCKLLNIIQPDIVVFGNKDYQQLQIIKAMVEDLLLPVQVIGTDTKREPNGLAMSSRNAYLLESEKQLASILYSALTKIAKAVQGDTQIKTTLRRQKQLLINAGFVLDYLEIRDAKDLSKTYVDSDTAVVLVAAKLGAARLIDNVIVHLSK
ncbi:MAG: pantoate--beta-alanine ligase [Gammaproteobacteria bacterium]|nr:pantoate--beta-alanine ligase [Gammaproteobacteria bacterium]